MRIAPAVVGLLVLASSTGAKLRTEWNYMDVSGTTKAYSMALDPDGDAWLAGSLRLSSDGKAQAIITFRHTASMINWSVSVLGTGGATQWEDGARSIVCDASTKTLVAGGTRWSGAGTQADGWLARIDLSSSLIEMWAGTVLTAPYIDAVYAVALASNGNIYAAGRRGNLKGNGDLWVGRFTGSGLRISELTEPNFWRVDDAATAIKVDPSGSFIYVGGYRTNTVSGRKEAWVAKYTADLNPAAPGTWKKSYPRPASSTGYVSALALDPSGSIWVAGAVTASHSALPPRKDVYVAKLDGTTGDVLWSRTVDGGQNGDDEALSIWMDASGTAYVGGYVNRPGLGDTLAVGWLARFGPDGTTVWQEDLAGPGPDSGRDDRVTAFFPDGTGGYYAAGSTVDRIYNSHMFARHVRDYPEVPATAPVIGRAHAVPNPFRPGSGGGQDASAITFLELAPGATVRIYTMAGALVAELTDSDRDGKASWDVKNKNGRDLVSGIYLYAVKPETGPVVRGKVVIIR